ncbi:MAG: beta-lactamase family protein [Oscillospiraceae bacterium]|nr:beta-lactamase family protein [Oscillospiraceae bacterium]
MDNLNRVLEKICTKHKLVGANVALYDSERIVYSYNYGYANKEQQMKSTNDSLYMIGSNTKVLTAVCIMKLMENGDLSLDDDIRKFIPEFEVKSTFSYEKITIGNLLMHRSGLLCDLYNMSYDQSGDFREVISHLKNTYLIASPGTMFAYSNVGYTVLGVVIERASGMPYQQFVQKTIAQPLGIGIHFLQTEEQRERYAKTISLCYNRKGETVTDPLGTILPAGSNTYMSMADFVKFGQIFLKKDGTILKKDTLDLMETLECPEDIDRELWNAGYGLLHHLNHYGENVGKIIGHGGDTFYHHSAFEYIPGHNVGIMVFTNNEQGANARGEIVSKVLHTYLESMGIATATYPMVFNHVSGNCDECVGKYATPLGIFDIRKGSESNLTTKLYGLRIALKRCEDGFWQLWPKSILSHLPLIKQQISRMRIKFAWYSGKKVLVLESRYPDNVNQTIVGGVLEETSVPESFKKACGSYELVNERLKAVKGSCLLRVEKGILVLKVRILGGTMELALNAVGDNLAFVQGFGRNTGNDVILTDCNGAKSLVWCGLHFQKK